MENDGAEDFLMAEYNEDDVLQCTLTEMGLGEHFMNFKEKRMGVSDLLNLSLNSIMSLLFPYPKFPRHVPLQFLTKYIKYMKSLDIPLHESLIEKCLGPADSSKEAIAPPTSQDSTFTRAMESLFEKRFGSLSRSKDDVINDDTTKDPDYSPEKDSEDSDDGSLSVNHLTCKVSERTLKDNSNLPKSDDQSKSPSGAGNQKQAASSPQVDLLACGSKRSMTKIAERDIDDLNLRALLDEHPYTEGVLSSYECRGLLKESERSTILNILIPWLLKRSLYPTERHYGVLRKKILDVFPTEEGSRWYEAPRSEENPSAYPRGKLPDKVRNVKEKLRHQGSLHAKRQKTKTSNTTPYSENLTADEAKAIEWLKRNKDPENDVLTNWKACSKARIQELFQNPDLQPSEYVKKWNDLLKLPFGYRMILEDFEVLPNIIETYKCVEGKGGNLLLNWETFSGKVQTFASEGDGKEAVLDPKQKKEFAEHLEKAATQNDKDYVILRTLPLLCKQKGRVKIGSTSMKPSTKESMDAFILNVTVAADFEEKIRLRSERNRRLAEPVQPFVLVIADKPYAVQAAYVILDGVPWKVGSVLSAVDVCFKACFAINCRYPPEAHHLWILIQKYLYKITCPGDRSIGTVMDLIKSLDKC